MSVLRTADERFASLPGYPFEPHYVQVETEGIAPVRMHYVNAGDDLFAGDAERFPAGRQHSRLGAVSQQRGNELRGRIQQVLAVVQHQQQTPGANELGDRLRQRHTLAGREAKRDRHDLSHRVRIGCDRQLT
jgi:hypothetical protein